MISVPLWKIAESECMTGKKRMSEWVTENECMNKRVTGWGNVEENDWMNDWAHYLLFPEGGAVGGGWGKLLGETRLAGLGGRGCLGGCSTGLRISLQL